MLLEYASPVPSGAVQMLITMMRSSGRAAGDRVVAWGHYALCIAAAVIRIVADMVQVRLLGCAVWIWNNVMFAYCTVDTTHEVIPFDIHI